MWYYCILDTTADTSTYASLKSRLYTVNFPRLGFKYTRCISFRCLNMFGQTRKNTAITIKQNTVSKNPKQKIIEFELFLDVVLSRDTLYAVAKEIASSFPSMEFHFKWISDDVRQGGYFHYDAANLNIYQMVYQNPMYLLNAAIDGFNFDVNDKKDIVKQSPNMKDAKGVLLREDLFSMSSKVHTSTNETKDLFRMCANLLV